MTHLCVILCLLIFVDGYQCHPCDIIQSQKHNGILANCSHRDLSSVPKDLPTNITAIDLSYNRLQVLQNFTFRNFFKVTFINFNSNNLQALESMAFYGLFKLQVLNLRENKLRSSHSSLPYGVFNNLTDLHTLILEHVFFEKYPDWIFPPLVNLKKLCIDPVSIPIFGERFSHLKQLEYLQMDGKCFPSDRDCAITEFRNETFHGLRNTALKTLNVSHCFGLLLIETGVFEPIASLDTLIFSKLDIGVQQSLRILKPFVGKKMSKIDLSSVYPRFKPIFPTSLNSFLTKNDTEFLRQICVSDFIFRGNHIVYIEDSALNENPFAKCLETLDLSQNSIIGSMKFFFRFQDFQNLRKLFMGDETFKGLGATNSAIKNFEKISIAMPSSIETLSFSGLFKEGSALNLRPVSILEFKNTEHLKTFIFSNNDLTNSITIRGLDNIERLDLSKNYIGDIKNIQLRHLNKVRYLSIHDCNLRFSENDHGNFMSFPDIQYLDMSRNLLSKFPTLPNPYKVKQLILSQNSFNNLPVDLESFINLQSLDLTFNAISFLDEALRDEIDTAHARTNLKIHLGGNTFSCGCKGLSFIQWIVESHAVYEKDRNFPCILDNGTTTNILKVMSDIQLHSRHCRGEITFILTIILGLLLLMTITGTYMIMKNPTRYQNMILRIIGVAGRVLCPDEFKFMLYVAYTSNDIPLVYRNLRPALERKNVTLFLKDIEVLPGHDIADAVCTGINVSWKTLLIVSWDFLNDPWSDFIINSALYSMTEMIPNRIIVLLVDGVQLSDLPDTLVSAVDEDLFIEYDAKVEHEDWNELVRHL